MAQQQFKINARSLVIASVSPFAPERLERPYSPNPNGGGTVFELPEYTLEMREKKMPPVTLKIYDSFQVESDIFGGGEKTPRFVSVDVIAKDIVSDHWALGDLDSGGLGPGIWICQNEESAKAEMPERLNQTMAFCQWLYQMGQKYSSSPSTWVNISKRNQTAGLWLGKSDSWIKGLVVEDTQKCPNCRTNVDPLAYTCMNCKWPLKPMPAEMVAQLQASQQGMANPMQQGMAVGQVPAKPPMRT